MKKINYIIGLSIVFSTFSCVNLNEKADGYGNFEATEVIISAESNGKIMAFDIEEGSVLEQGAYLGYIDTLQLSYNKYAIEVSKALISSKSKSVLSQIDVLKAKLNTLEINKSRFKNLLKDKAATQKQLDDIQGEIDVTQQQISSIKIQNTTVLDEIESIEIQQKKVEDQVQKSKIINPVSGTVLTKYAEPNEVATFGKPLYKIANLQSMQLRVYVSENQLAGIKIGQKVTVKVDDGASMKEYKGTINWIASEAEFTPKIIQTKEERVALVYAIKISVPNDGGLKIGMPAEMWFDTDANE